MVYQADLRPHSQRESEVRGGRWTSPQDQAVARPGQSQ